MVINTLIKYVTNMKIKIWATMCGFLLLLKDACSF
jgi:hypothetical protein